MKKIIYSFLAFAMAAMTFSSCEDVPAPYDYTYNGPGKDTTKVIVVEPAGDGTAESPYNVARTLDLIQSGNIPSGKVFVKGIVNGDNGIDVNYGNATFYISDIAGSETKFEIYRCYNYNGEKFTTGDEFKEGDTVVLYGELVNYNGRTPEMTQGGQIYSINGVTKGNPGGGEGTKAEPKGTGTQADPYNAAGAIKAASALADGDKTTGVYVSGIICKIKSVSTQYGNAEYYISEDGKDADAFYIFRGYYLKGEKFTSEDQIKVGQKVVVKGDLVNYKGNTPEMAQGSEIISIDGSGNTGGGGEDATVGLNETFQSGQGNFTIKDITLGEGASYVWKADTKNGYMKASAYVNKTNIPCQSQLISPAFSLKGLSSATLSFQHTGKYFGKASDECKVLASTDGKTWTELTVSAYPDGSSWAFVDATCDMKAFAGKETVYIAFQYTSTADAAPTWEIKNVVVK